MGFPDIFEKRRVDTSENTLKYIRKPHLKYIGKSLYNTTENPYLKSLKYIRKFLFRKLVFSI
jgi:hypothetical protein